VVSVPIDFDSPFLPEEAAMAIAFQCSCGKALRAQSDAAGKRTKCPHCGNVLTIPGSAPKAVGAANSGQPAGASFGISLGDDGELLDLDWGRIEAPPAPTPAPPPSTPIVDLQPTSNAALPVSNLNIADLPDLPRPVGDLRQYRVITQRDLGGPGKFNAAKLEEMLNAYAGQGWSLKSALSMNLPSHSGNHDEIIVILER
jgi:hypothetical protein